MAGALHAPVAQLDRVSVFETEGWRFEPVRARQFLGNAGKACTCPSSPHGPDFWRPRELTAHLASSFRSAVRKAALTLIVDCSRLVELAYVDRGCRSRSSSIFLRMRSRFDLGGVNAGHHEKPWSVYALSEPRDCNACCFAPQCPTAGWTTRQKDRLSVRELAKASVPCSSYKKIAAS
jgi:hypothetical protein